MNHLNLMTDPPDIRDLELLTRLLDTRFRIPGTSFRFGIDPLIGLFPVAGDAVSLTISGYILWRAWRLGLPKGKLARMLWNLLYDALLGSLPLAGDAFDFFYKANALNLKLITTHLKDTARDEQPANDKHGAAHTH